MNLKVLEEFLDSLLVNKKIPGFDCLIYYKHQPVFRYSNGYADLKNKKPIAEDQLYHVYSCTKPMTCVAALQLFERGKFRLTDAVSDYIPEFKHMTVQQENGEITEAKNVMKIKDLFCMTAGFGYDLNTPALMKFREETNGECPTDLLPKYLAEEPLHFEPSTQWRYSLCHDVLAVLIERICGMTFGEYMRKHIFEPLNMQDSGFFLTEERMAKMAQKYQFDSVTGEPRNVGFANGFQFGSKYESGGAGLITSVNDYMKFEEALCKGNRILRKATTELMYQDHLTPVNRESYYLTQQRGFGYGLGVRTIIDQAQACSTAGFGDFGWGGAAGSFATINPKKELSVFYAQHMLSSDPMHAAIRNLVYAWVVD